MTAGQSCTVTLRFWCVFIHIRVFLSRWSHCITRLCLPLLVHSLHRPDSAVFRCQGTFQNLNLQTVSEDYKGWQNQKLTAHQRIKYGNAGGANKSTNTKHFSNVSVLLLNAKYELVRDKSLLKRALASPPPSATLELAASRVFYERERKFKHALFTYELLSDYSYNSEDFLHSPSPSLSPKLSSQTSVGLVFLVFLS